MLDDSTVSLVVLATAVSGDVSESVGDDNTLAAVCSMNAQKRRRNVNEVIVRLCGDVRLVSLTFSRTVRLVNWFMASHSSNHEARFIQIGFRVESSRVPTITLTS